jgi:hypothetical protein
MKIVFHSNQLGIRGTEVALYQYADYNETILGNISYIAAPVNSDMGAYEKFVNRFGYDKVLLYNDFSDLSNQVVIDHKIDVAYLTKAGPNDGKLIPGIKNIIHYVFEGSDPHGEIYIGISDWLGKEYNTDYLPYIVTMPDVKDSYREYFNFTETDIVFGRYGGYDQFDVPYLGEVLDAAANAGLKFILMNTKVITKNHPNIIYLNSTTDVDSKTAFINTCDAMLHGRTEGESFGLAIAEFLYQNKPIITNIHCRDRNHIGLLKDKGFYYSNANELYLMLINFKKKNYSVKNLVEIFSPEKVMSKFNTFL